MTRYQWLKQKVEYLRQNPTNECVEWPFAKSCEFGYGQVRIGKKRYQVHRVAYRLFYGQSLQQWGLHSCNNGKCFNPLHIKDGDAKENYDDMVRSGNRRTRGAKSTESQVKKAIHLLATTPLSCQEVGQRLDIKESHIMAIKYGKVWKHIPRPKSMVRNYNCLTEPEVIQIIKLLDSGISQGAIARKFGASQSTISEIKLGHTWSHLPRPWHN